MRMKKTHHTSNKILKSTFFPQQKDILKLQKMYNCVDGGTEMAVTTTSPITTPSPGKAELIVTERQG